MNIDFFYFLHGLAFVSPWFDSLIWFLAVPLIYIMILVAAVFIFVHYKLYEVKNIPTILRDKWKEIASLILSPALAWILASILKILIHTDRPFVALSNIHTLFEESGYAFPSGHATAISALAFAIYFKNKKLGFLFLAAALLIGFARVVGGVHYPVDILGGYVIGFLVAYFLKSR